ncbi:MAG: hypothetical protein AAF417_21395 [Pseudomonadota bacterium]
MLKIKAMNGWRLFWLVSLPMCAAMVVEMLGTDLRTAPGVSEMIGFSVRWAVPFIFLVVATSPAYTLFPCSFTAWLLRNRRYIGLCFAVAMGWQGLFIFIMSNFHRGYYYDEIYYLRDELEGSTGYIFLVAMVVTSFRFGRKYFSNRQWTAIHRSGVYFLWAYPFSVYWWALYYYGNPTSIDHVFYWTGFLAFAMRIAAWGKRRHVAAANAGASASFALRPVAAAVVALGLVASGTGAYWQEPVTTFLTTPSWSANLELWLPFWPFEPFLPLLLIGVGTFLFTVSTEQPAADGRRASLTPGGP